MCATIADTSGKYTKLLPKGRGFFDGLKAAFCGSAGFPHSSDCLLPAVNRISTGTSEESHRDFLTVVEPSPFRMMRGRGLAADWALPRQTHKPGTAAFRTMKKHRFCFTLRHPAPFFRVSPPCPSAVSGSVLAGGLWPVPAI